MVARNGSHGRGRRAPAAATGRRPDVGMALEAARELPPRVQRLLRARLQHWRLRARRAVWHLVGWFALGLAALATLLTGVCMLCYALAAAIAHVLAVPLWAGCGIFALAVLAAVAGAFVLALRHVRRALAGGADAVAQARVEQSGRKLLLGLATLPGLLLAALAGFTTVFVAPNRVARRLALAGLSAMRTIERSSRLSAGDGRRSR